MRAIYTKKSRVTHLAHFDEASEEALKEIHAMLVSRWRLKDSPSISLTIQCIVREFAAAAAKDGDHDWLKGLMFEIKARGGAVGRRDQFRRDGNPEKIAELEDGLAKAEAISDAQDILDSTSRP